VTRALRSIGSLLLAALLTGACSESGSSDLAPANELTIAVNAPSSVSPFIGQTIARGVTLAIQEINERGGITIGEKSFTLRMERFDNELSPQKALQNVRAAVSEEMIAIVDEGTGVEASWQLAARANVPIGIVYQGGEDLVDVETRPNVFRVAPTDHGIAFRLAEYLVPKGLKIAFLHDDSQYGRQGKVAFDDAFGHTPEAVVFDTSVPSGSGDVAPQVLEARRSGATALLVWATPSSVAEIVRATRSSGWDVPLYSAPSAQDPLVRQQLSDHPEWVDGLVFASGRMVAEKGPGPFMAFKRKYEDAFGVDEVGVTTSEGETVVQPPEYPMYSYDFVKVLAAAIEAARATSGPAVLDALNQVDVQGANGDERGFNELNHEGVVDDDVYFARFEDMVFVPVEDDPLSSTLEPIDQTVE
jgi:ABC-type branched-subunit amino acid transport system substrate-binding protein